jgi:RND superfamily putative drug exporter
MSKSTQVKAPNLNSLKGHRKPLWVAAAVVLLWFMISGVAGPLFGSLSTVQKNDNSKFLPANSEASKATDAIAKFAATKINAFPALILFEGQVTPTNVAATKSFIQGIAALPLVDDKGALLKDKSGNSVRPLIGSYFVKTEQAGAFPAQDGKALLASLPISADVATQLLPDGKAEALPGIITAVRYYSSQFAAKNGFTTHTTGAGGLFADLFGAFGGLDSKLLIVTGLLVSIILIVVYRSPILWILPLMSAGFALTLSGGVIYELAKHNVLALDGQSQGILSVLVLGAATDYALLLIARYREELHLHRSRVDAMKAAWRGVVEPILASGSTVAIGLLVLLLSELTNNRGLGPVGAIGIACSMVTILTFLPALLVLFGRWIFWPKRPLFDHADEKLTGVWSKVANATQQSPRKYWLVSGGALLVLAAFISTLGANGLSTVQSFTSRPDSVVGQELLLKHFPGGQGDPTQVVVKVGEVDAVTAKLQSVAGVSSVSPMVDPVTQGPKVVDGLEVLNVTLTSAPDSAKATALIPTLRAAVKSIDPSILTGGTTAVYYDTHKAAQRDRALIIPVILLVIAIILGFLLRSIAAAGLLLMTVVLSFAATLGVSSLVFHHLFHFAGEDTSYPLFSFVFLVALGIDYNIFLMTRVREETIKHGTRVGMTKGVTVTGGVITSAGIVLAATFTVLGILPLVFLAELGFTVGFGVLLDTLIVRSILVPALVHSIGPKIWWPSALSKESN